MVAKEILLNRLRMLICVEKWYAFNNILKEKNNDKR